MDRIQSVILPMVIENLASLSLYLGCAACAIIAVARAFPFWPSGWLNQKPLSCPTCMSLWSSLATVGTVQLVMQPFTFTASGLLMFSVTWGASMGVALFMSSLSGIFASANIDLFNAPEADVGTPQTEVSDSPLK